MVTDLQKREAQFTDGGYVVLSKGLECSLPHIDFAMWRQANEQSVTSPLPLGLALSEADIALLEPRIRAVLDQAEIEICAASDQATVHALAARWAVVRLGDTQRQIGDMRAALAAIRMQHEETQRNFAAAEDWMSAMLAPRFVQLRHFPRAGGQIMLTEGQSLRQVLPCCSRGLAAVDLVLGGGGNTRFRLLMERWNGDLLAEAVQVPLPETPGWCRCQLPVVLAGAEETVVLRLICDAGALALGLARPSPFDHLRAQTESRFAASPLALRLWAGLPGASLPPLFAPDVATAPSESSFLPLAELPEPVSLRGSASLNRTLGALDLRPDQSGQAIAAIRDLARQNFGMVEAFLQMLGDEGAIVTFSATAPGAIGAGGEGYRLDSGHFMPVAQYARLADRLKTDKFDLILRIENAHPGAALRLWALKFSRGGQNG